MRNKEWQPLILDVVDDIPYRQIRQLYYPNKTIKKVSEISDLGATHISRVERHVNSNFMSTAINHLRTFGLDLAIYEDNKFLTTDLNLYKLIEKEKVELKSLIEDMGYSNTYFLNKKTLLSYTTDDYRDILDYLGYQLAIIQKDLQWKIIGKDYYL